MQLKDDNFFICGIIKIMRMILATNSNTADAPVVPQQIPQQPTTTRPPVP